MLTKESCHTNTMVWIFHNEGWLDHGQYVWKDANPPQQAQSHGLDILRTKINLKLLDNMKKARESKTWSLQRFMTWRSSHGMSF